MGSDELRGFRPQRRDRLRRIVQVDREAVRFVVVLHVSENIVVHIAEEMDLWLNSPVVLCVRKRRVLVEKTAVPTAHLMVGLHSSVLNIVLLQDLGRFLEKLLVDP